MPSSSSGCRARLPPSIAPRFIRCSKEFAPSEIKSRRGALRLASSAQCGKALLRVEYDGAPLRCRLEMEVEIGGQERRLDAEPLGLRGRAVMPDKVADQRILDRKDRIGTEVFVGPIENMRRHRLV